MNDSATPDVLQEIRALRLFCARSAFPPEPTDNTLAQRRINTATSASPISPRGDGERQLDAVILGHSTRSRKHRHAQPENQCLDGVGYLKLLMRSLPGARMMSGPWYAARRAGERL